MLFCAPFESVVELLLITAPTAFVFGFGRAVGRPLRDHIFLLPRWFGKTDTAIVCGVPGIAFVLLFVIVMDQAFEWAGHRVKCPDWPDPVRHGSDFTVRQAAKLPLFSAPSWVHDIYSFSIEILTFAIVSGAFAFNVLCGAMQTAPRAQIEKGKAYGMRQRQTFWRIQIRAQR